MAKDPKATTPRPCAINVQRAVFWRADIVLREQDVDVGALDRKWSSDGRRAIGDGKYINKGVDVKLMKIYCYLNGQFALTALLIPLDMRTTASRS